MAFTGNYTCTVFKTGLLNGDYDFAVDTFNIALYTNSATLNADTTAYTTTGEVTDAGYTAGGNALTPTVGTSGGVSFVTFANTSWSGAITARGALIYKVGGGDPAVCVLDFGSDKTSITTFTVEFPAATNTAALIRLS
jgi:hypothetical protein